MLPTILNVVFVLVAISIIALILLQRGAGAQAGSGFGAGASATVFGARGSANFLSSATKWLSEIRLTRWEDEDFVGQVSPAGVSEIGDTSAGGPLVAIVDFGLKSNIVSSLRRRSHWSAQCRHVTGQRPPDALYCSMIAAGIRPRAGTAM